MKCCPNCGQEVPSSSFVIIGIHAIRNDIKVKLQAQEATVLELLRKGSPNVVTTRALLGGMYGCGGPETQYDVLKNIIWRLRDKIKPLNATIETDVHHGYRLRVHDLEVAA